MERVDLKLTFSYSSEVSLSVRWTAMGQLWQLSAGLFIRDDGSDKCGLRCRDMAFPPCLCIRRMDLHIPHGIVEWVTDIFEWVIDIAVRRREGSASILTWTNFK